MNVVNHRQSCIVVRPTCEVNGKWRILTHSDIKGPNFFKFELDIYDYVPVQIFISIRSAGASLQIGKILRSCDFFLVSCLVMLYFLIGHAPRSNPWMDFHGLWLIRRIFAQGRSFWGLRQYRNSFGGNIPEKLPKRGVNRLFQAKRAEYKNRDILHSINTIHVQF